MVREWSCLHSQVSVVLLGGGPPCQGVSGLNADRKGAMKDERSVLFLHVKRIEGLVKQCFPWCQVHTLMESVASMDEVDKNTMSESFEDSPWRCDAGTLTWCSRPRLYWITWELQQGEGVVLQEGSKDREVVLTAWQDLETVCKPGWIKVDPSRAYSTFTTSRPRDRPGHRPAGIQHCSDEEIARWVGDQHRFPPYQYQTKNLLINKKGDLRVPDVEEREFLLGFPVGYTAIIACLRVSARVRPITTFDLPFLAIRGPSLWWHGFWVSFWLLWVYARTFHRRTLLTGWSLASKRWFPTYCSGLLWGQVGRVEEQVRLRH